MPVAAAGTVKLMLKLPVVSEVPVTARTLLNVIVMLDVAAKPVPVTVTVLPVVPVVLLRLILDVTLNVAPTAVDPVATAVMV